MRITGLLIATSALLLFPKPLAALPEAWWSPHDSLEHRMVDLLNGAGDHVEAAIYEFSSEALAQALERAERRGVLSRLLVDCEHTGRLPKGFTAAEVRCTDGRYADLGAMHNKFVILDHQRVVTGSFNWTASAERLNFENLLREDDPTVVSRFSSLFQTLWARGKAVRLGYARHPPRALLGDRSRVPRQRPRGMTRRRNLRSSRRLTLKRKP